MKTEQLESLLIDQALGELSEEAVALLEAYLAHFPAREEEASRVRQAVGLTEAAVLSRPLLQGWEAVAESESEALRFPERKSFFPAALFRIAAALALLAIAVGAGFFAGKEIPESTHPVESAATGPVVPSPWARYHFEESGRLALISSPQPKKS